MPSGFFCLNWLGIMLTEAVFTISLQTEKQCKQPKSRPKGPLISDTQLHWHAAACAGDVVALGDGRVGTDTKPFFLELGQTVSKRTGVPSCVVTRRHWQLPGRQGTSPAAGPQDPGMPGVMLTETQGTRTTGVRQRRVCRGSCAVTGHQRRRVSLVKKQVSFIRSIRGLQRTAGGLIPRSGTGQACF